MTPRVKRLQVKCAKHKKQEKKKADLLGAGPPLQFRARVQCVSAANTHPPSRRNLFLSCGFILSLVLPRSHSGSRACSRHARATTRWFHFCSRIYFSTLRRLGGSVRRRLFSICLCIDFMKCAMTSAPAGGGLLAE